MDEEKDRMRARFARGTKKFEQRRENLAARKRRGGPLAHRPRHEEEDGVDSTEELADPSEQSSVQRQHGFPRGRARPAPNQAEAVARVAEVARTVVHVLFDDGAVHAVGVTPRVLAGGALVVGDEVLVGGPAGPRADGARVLEALPRRTLLARRAPGNEHAQKLIAANVDVGLVLLAPRADGLSLGFLERASAVLRAGGIEPVAVVTKVDLLTPEVRAELEALLAPWSAEGLPIHWVGAPTGEGLPELQARLAGRVAVLFGHSGVGKSTLVNALDPAAAQAVGEVRAVDGRGRHTTTASRLVSFRASPRDPLGALVDTPGIRVLVPAGLGAEELVRELPELAPLAATCRFRDCAHAGEPGCAVAEAAAREPRVARALARLRRLLDSIEEGR